MKIKLIFGCCFLIIPSLAFPYFTVTGVGFTRDDAKTNTTNQAFQYCQSITNGEKYNFPIERVWIPNIENDNFVLGNCRIILSDPPPNTCFMKFECLNSDLKKDAERIDDILDEARVTNRGVIEKILDKFEL